MKPVVASSAARFTDLSKIHGILDTEIWICKNMPIYFCDHTHSSHPFFAQKELQSTPSDS